MSLDNLTHQHSHGNDHDHQGHSHSHGKNAPHKILMISIVLTLGFAVIEAFGGWYANSLALLGDAGHMGSDAVALAIAAFAAWISNKPPSSKHSYGLQRAEVVAAWISSLMMVLISVAIVVEAINRIKQPMEVKGLSVIVIALAGLAINIFVAWLLARGERTLNIRAALMHVMSDILGSVAALIAGAVIYFTHWSPIDPILSILISVLILGSAFKLLRESLLILMEGVPEHISIDQVSTEILKINGVRNIHDLHIWTLSSGMVALSAHIDIHELSDWGPVLVQLKSMLETKYSISHITLQPEPLIFDCEPCQEPPNKNN